MRTNRRRYLRQTLVLSALFVILSLLFSGRAFAADDAVELVTATHEQAGVAAGPDSSEQADEVVESEQDRASIAGTAATPDESDVVTGDIVDEAVDAEPTDDAGAEPDILDADEGDTAGDGSAVLDAEAGLSADDEVDEEDATAEADQSQMLVTTASTATSLNGVDISGWNDNIDFSKLGDFVIIKATEWSSRGYTYYTSGGNAGQTEALSYLKQAESALKAGKLIGFYHFASSYSHSKQTYEQQAQAFINAVKPYLGQALLVLDWENGEHYTSSGSQIYSRVESDVSGAKKWLDYVYQQTGVKPVIYMNYSCANSYDWSSVVNAGYQLWGARYFYKYYYDAGTGKGTKIKAFVSDPDMYMDNEKSKRWGAWGTKPLIYQYTATCNLHGNKNYDANKFYGSKADWLKLAEAAHEVSSTAAEAAKFLTNKAVYSFTPMENAPHVVYASSDNALLASSNYRNGYWVVNNLGEGLYRFVNFGTGDALSFSPESGKITNGSNVITNGTVDIWRLIRCSNGSYALVPNGYDSFRLDVSGGYINASGTNLQLYTGNGTAAQRFFFTHSDVLTEAYASGANSSEKVLEDGVYAFKCSDDSSKVIDISGGSTDNGANVQIYRSNDSFAQRFRVSHVGNGLYTIESLKSGKVLDVAGGSTASGANVQQYVANYTMAQYWCVREVAQGVYTFLSANSGKALDVAGGKLDSGTNVQVYYSNGTNAQRFLLVRDSVLEESCASGKVFGEGVYSFGSSFAPTKAIDIASGSKASGANVQLYRANGTLAQKFELAYLGNGLYTIKSAVSGKVLDVAGGSMLAGANVQQYSGNGTRAQAWYFVKKDGCWQICSALNGKAVSLESDKDANGVNICMKDIDDKSKSQQFIVQQKQLFDDGVYFIKSSLGNYRLSVSGASKSAGANIQIWTTNTSPGQRWKITHLGSGVYSIISANSGLAMEVANASKAYGANVRQGTYTGAASQKWVFTITSTGAVCIRNLASGLVLDVANGRKANGTNVQQYGANGTSAQSFAVTSA